MRYLSRFFSLLMLGLISGSSVVHGQCSGGGSAGALTPAPAAAWQTVAVVTGNYYTFTVPAAAGCSFPTYYFSFCAADGGSAGFDTQLTILDNTGIYAGGYSDDNCGLASFLSWTPTASGTYRVLPSTYYCGSGSAATLAYRATTPPAPDPELSLVGDASVTGPGCATLTTATNNQRGCVWDIDNTLNFAAGFTIDFTVNLGSTPGGADGMSFVIQNSPAGRCACGIAGGSLGSSGIPNSLIVEIDTYLNTEDRDDGMAGVLCAGGPEPDHLDIWLNGNLNPVGGACPGVPGARVIPAAVKLMNGAVDYEIENGLNHTLRVSWVPGAPGTLTAALWNTAISTMYGSVSYSFNPMVVFGTTTPFFGFTASTGGLNNQQTVCMPTLILASEVVVLEAEPQGESVQLSWNAPDGYTVSEVYHSADGSHWDLLAAVPTSYKQSQQMLNDVRPLHGQNWYEVFMKDDDGNVKPSNRVQVNVQNENAFTVYPNPARDVIYVRIPGAGNHSLITVTDLAGKKVAEAVSSGDETTLQVGALAPGLYCVEINTGIKTYRQKVVIE